VEKMSVLKFHVEQFLYYMKHCRRGIKMEKQVHV